MQVKDGEIFDFSLLLERKRLDWVWILGVEVFWGTTP